MDLNSFERASINHVVAMPSPGRGHINPMLNFCKIMVSKRPGILVTFVVTEEWLGFIGCDPKPDNIHFISVPNVVPSELDRGKDLYGFIEAVYTKMEAPFELLLDGLKPPAALILADIFLGWPVRVGNRRDIPVASFCPMSATVFSVVHHFDLLAKNGHYPVDLSEKGDEFVDYIPGLSSILLKDLASFINWNSPVFSPIMKAFSLVSRTQFLLFSTIYELEPQVIDTIRNEFSFSVYTIGPAIPYFKLEFDTSSNSIDNGNDYLSWLDCQPSKSVLYISLGSFLYVSSAQMVEFAVGLRKSGVRFLWVARGQDSRLKEICGDLGLIVPWCDQLRVLCHTSIGGFWSHCGWNSVQEGGFAGVPFLTFPIIADQNFNVRRIVDELKIGYRVKKESEVECLVTGDEIAGLVQKLMDLESHEGREMRRKATGLQEIFRGAIAEGGSSESNINTFIRDMSSDSH